MSEKFSVLCDLDGVLHRASQVIPGASRFVNALRKSGRKYVFMTNSPDHSPQELSQNLKKLRIDIDPSHFYTSAQAIGAFLVCHAKCPRVYLIGSPALRRELVQRRIELTEKNPEFVVFGTEGKYGTSEINRAVEYVLKGAKLITAAGETTSLTEDGLHAGCGAFVAPIEKATGQRAYVIGKPNHFMIRQAEELWGVNPLQTLMIGDSLETDIDVGLQTQMKTLLVLSGNTTRSRLAQSAYKPDYVFSSVAQINLDRLP